MELPSTTKEVIEARNVSGVSLHGDLERPLYKGVNVKTGLSWRPQDVGDARAVGYLSRKATNREWNQAKRKKCVIVIKAERSWRSEDHF